MLLLVAAGVEALAAGFRVRGRVEDVEGAPVPGAVVRLDGDYLWAVTDAKGVFFGLTYTHTRAHLIRAVMEGTAYALRHNIETAHHAGGEVHLMRAMGGSANSLVWTQIKSDVTGKEMEVPSSDTATGLGAAILAGMGCGLYATFEEAVSRTVHVRRTHTPNPDNRAVYEAGYSNYLELYQRLEPMMTGRN